MRRPFWKESDSTAMPEEWSALHADDARARHSLIGAELRRWYDAIAEEPVPDEWLGLLDQSDSDRLARENGQSDKSGNAGNS
jgi:hypothetical protein